MSLLPNEPAPFELVPILYGRDRKPYHADPALLSAANAALLLDMPLLLTGEPGCGKTHFAWAAAGALHCSLHPGAGKTAPDGLPEPLTCYIRSDTRARDLLYHYDAVRRFGDAQHGDGESRRLAADARHYVELKELGRALMCSQRQVVLIDEIDKAPRDLPNDLLHELDRGDFEIPEISEKLPSRGPVGMSETVESHGFALWRRMTNQSAAKPFIIITSNRESQLPDAFLRRCIFYHIPFPSSERLQDIVRDHAYLDLIQMAPGSGPPDNRLGGAAEEFVIAAVGLFEKVRGLGLTKKPATAELLNWVRALLRLANLSGVKRVMELARKATPDWQALPLLSCLIKLHEDWKRVLPAAG